MIFNDCLLVHNYICLFFGNKIGLKIRSLDILTLNFSCIEGLPNSEAMFNLFFQIFDFNCIADLEAFAAIIRRETDKEARGKQNAVIKELDPLIFTLHLGSMKIFFSNIETEEKTVDGEVLGELDQVQTFTFLLLENDVLSRSFQKRSCPLSYV